MSLAAVPIEFIGSFPDPQHRLEPALPEVAFLGRSNVGKSTLINAVVGRKIARTSSTPGKTQHLNVFRLPMFYLIDLPGYGYAKLPKTDRQRLKKLVRETVQRRGELRTVVWLLDIRHPPSVEDLAIRDLLADAGREAIVVLTKSDKLPWEQRRKAVLVRAGELEIDPDDLVVSSGSTGLGIDDLVDLIEDAVAR